MIIIPFFLTKKEPKKSSAKIYSDRIFARATAPETIWREATTFIRLCHSEPSGEESHKTILTLFSAFWHHFRFRCGA